MPKLYTFVIIVLFTLCGCVSLPKETVELSEITDHQISELQKSHIKFVQLYYVKLREDVNRFIDEKWTPSFLSKAVNNRVFRADLDDAYVVSSLSIDDISVQLKGNELQAPHKEIVIEGVKHAIVSEAGKLGQVLIEWSKEAQLQINKKRKELIDPLNEQESYIVEQINSAFFDLQRSQATIKAYLSSAVELKEKQELVISQLGALEKVEKVLNKVTDINGKLTDTLSLQDTNDAVTKFKKLIESTKSSSQNNRG